MTLQTRLRRGAALVVSIVVAVSIMSAAYAQSAGFAPVARDPRAAGLKPQHDSPEAGLWVMSDKAEEEARRSAELNSDPALTAYVRSVACKVAVDYCDELRVYVLDRPAFNAAMAPNGYMEVWSGLLLRATNEAELAFVLGHESGHFALSHSWTALQNQKARANTAMIASAVLAVGGVVAAAGAGSVQAAQSISDATNGLVNAVYLGAIAAIFRFSRAQEGEADAFGFNAALKAGYAPDAGVRLWKNLIEETAKSDFERVRKRQTRASVFDTHPLAADRVEILEGYAAGRTEGRIEAAAYRAAIRPHLSAWLKDDLRRKDFGQTLLLIDRLGRSKEDAGVLAFYRGEAFRLRRAEGDAARAEESYLAAIEHGDAPAAVYRELADIAEKRGEKDGMVQLLATYLARAPGAGDASFVTMRIEQAHPGYLKTVEQAAVTVGSSLPPAPETAQKTGHETPDLQEPNAVASKPDASGETVLPNPSLPTSLVSDSLSKAAP